MWLFLSLGLTEKWGGFRLSCMEFLFLAQISGDINSALYSPVSDKGSHLITLTKKWLSWNCIFTVVHGLNWKEILHNWDFVNHKLKPRDADGIFAALVTAVLLESWLPKEHFLDIFLFKYQMVNTCFKKCNISLFFT